MRNTETKMSRFSILSDGRPESDFPANDCFHPIQSPSQGFRCWDSRMSRPRLAAETRGRNGELAFERPVESGLGLVADFGCDLRYRITG